MAKKQSKAVNEAAVGIGAAVKQIQAAVAAKEVKAKPAKEPKVKTVKAFVVPTPVTALEGLAKETYEKLPLQAKQVIMAIGDGQHYSKEDWVARVSAFDGFVTRQPVIRIVAFYQARLLAAGFVARAN